MSKNEIIEQLKELIHDRYSFVSDDSEMNKIMFRDIKALESAIIIIENVNKNKIENSLLDFIDYNCGSQEKEEPSYDIKKMSYILESSLLGGLENDKDKDKKN